MKMRANYCLWIFLVCLLFSGLEAASNKVYAEDLCLKNPTAVIELDRYSYVVLTSARLGNLQSCEIFAKPKRGGSVVLSIKSYNLTSSDKLTIEDSDLHQVQLLGRREFFDERKSIISDGPIRVHFTPDPAVPHRKINFEFVFTQTHAAPCQHGDFECNNKECIDSALVCDGHNHCGDRSDQKKCGNARERDEQDERIVKAQPPVLAIAITVGASIFFIVLIVVMVFVIRRAANKKKEQQAAMSTFAATVPPQSPAASSAPQPPAASSAPQPHPSYWNRIRNSFRSTRNAHNAESSPTSEEPQMSGNHQVPSMYPNIHTPTAPEMNGVDNPDFKVEE